MLYCTKIITCTYAMYLYCRIKSKDISTKISNTINNEAIKIKYFIPRSQTCTVTFGLLKFMSFKQNS